MSPEQRAIACRRWRWLPGMLDADGFRVIRHGWSYDTKAPHDGRTHLCNALPWDITPPTLPDFRDAPTVGGLLSLAREAWSDPTISTFYDCSQGHVWIVYTQDDRLSDSGTVSHRGKCEAEALVMALEAAP